MSLIASLKSLITIADSIVSDVPLETSLNSVIAIASELSLE